MKKRASEHVRLDLIMLTLTFGIQTLIQIILSLNDLLASNVVYAESIFTDIASIAVNMLEISAMTAGLSIICVTRFMGKKKFPYSAIYAGSVLYRRLLALLTTLLFYESISVDDIWFSVSAFILDITMLTIAIVIFDIFAKKFRRKAVSHKKSSALFDEDATDINYTSVYPFKKIYGKGNTLQSALLSIGIMLSAVKIISRSIDILNMLINRYTPENLLYVILSYVTDIMIVALSYAISCYLLSVIYGQNEKRVAMRTLFEKD